MSNRFNNNATLNNMAFLIRHPAIARSVAIDETART